MRAIYVTEYGGPEVLRPAELPEPQPQQGHELIRVDRAGINYADTHQVENSYLAPTSLPLIPGAEVTGRLADSRRVVALLPSGGGYAELAVAPHALTFPLPDDVEDGAALALVLQGTTAWHLLRTSAHLNRGESVVVHAAAGGVGTLAVQLAKLWGAGRVIGVASTPEKRELARSLGADATVDSGAADFKVALLEANGGHTVDVVLDMAGGRTTDASLAALAPFGRLVVFGMASREAPSPVDPRALLRTSRAVIGFWLAHCMRRPDEYLAPAMRELIAMVQAGTLRPVVGGTYPLSEAARAHADLLARRTTGKLLLDPAG